MRKLVVGLIIALILVFASPVLVSGERGDMYDTLSTTRSVIIYDQNPLHLEVVRLTNSQYRIFGDITLCNGVFGIQAVGIGSGADSSVVMANPITGNYVVTDTCGVESFTFGIHGGILRKQLEKEGNAIIVLYSMEGYIIVKLNPTSEIEILGIILKPDKIQFEQ